MSHLFFFNDTAPTEIYTLSLHDALPIYNRSGASRCRLECRFMQSSMQRETRRSRSEEHTSELQSQSNLVCRLLLEKKKTVCYATSSILHQLPPMCYVP